MLSHARKKARGLAWPGRESGQWFLPPFSGGASREGSSLSLPASHARRFLAAPGSDDGPQCPPASVLRPCSAGVRLRRPHEDSRSDPMAARVRHHPGHPITPTCLTFRRPERPRNKTGGPTLAAFCVRRKWGQRYPRAIHAGGVETVRISPKKSPTYPPPHTIRL